MTPSQNTSGGAPSVLEACEHGRGAAGSRATSLSTADSTQPPDATSSQASGGFLPVGLELWLDTLGIIIEDARIAPDGTPNF